MQKNYIILFTILFVFILGCQESSVKTPEQYYSNAIQKAQKGDVEGALADFNKAIEMKPDYAEAYNNRAFYIKEKKGDYKGAIEDYSKSIELSKNNDTLLAYAYNNRGLAKFKINAIQGAFNDIQLSIKYYPYNSYAFRNRALVYISRENLELACIDLKKALELGYEEDFGSEVSEMIEKYCTPE